MRPRLFLLLDSVDMGLTWSSDTSDNRIEPRKLSGKMLDLLTKSASMIRSFGTSESGALAIPRVPKCLMASDRAIYKWTSAKKILAFKIGGMGRFSRAEIDRWLPQQTSVVHPACSSNPMYSGCGK